MLFEFILIFKRHQTIETTVNHEDSTPLDITLKLYRNEIEIYFES